MFDSDDFDDDHGDWSNDFDDFDSADWEDYLGGPDDIEIEEANERYWSHDDD